MQFEVEQEKSLERDKSPVRGFFFVAKQEVRSFLALRPGWSFAGFSESELLSFY